VKFRFWHFATGTVFTHRFFLERQRFELFFPKSKNQTAERKLLARESSVLKALDRWLGLSPGQIAPGRAFIFQARCVGEGRSKVWDLQAGTAGARTYFRKIPKTFFCLSSLSPFDQQPQMFGAGPSCAQKPCGGQPGAGSPAAQTTKLA
jgi:hypothetical protein